MKGQSPNRINNRMIVQSSCNSKPQEGMGSIEQQNHEDDKDNSMEVVTLTLWHHGVFGICCCYYQVLKIVMEVEDKKKYLGTLNQFIVVFKMRKNVIQKSQ